MYESETTTFVQATLLPSGNRFASIPGQSLLESGLSAGVALPYGCANGSCGECLARVRQGEVKKLRPHDFTVTEAQKLAGDCLLCSYGAVTDVGIEVHEARSVNDIVEQSLQAKLCRHERTSDVDIVTLKFVRGKALRFLPGQRISLQLANGQTTSLPIASCPCNSQIIELHLFTSVDIQLEPSAVAVIEQVTTQRQTTVVGPTGSFTLSSERKKPKIFIAHGGDFSQMQGMVEQVFNADLGTPCCLIWKASSYIPHYRSNLCRSWHDAFDDFSFIPIGSDEDPMASLPAWWRGHLQSSEVYLGGEYHSLIAELIEQGVAPTSIYYPSQVGTIG